MKRYLYPFVLLALLFTACKKSKNNPITTMYVNISSDSSWTTSNVTTSNSGYGVSIIGINNKTGEKIVLSMYNYRAGNNVYYIDFSVGGGSTSNTYGSTASYEYTGYSVDAGTGSISITGSTENTIIGSFDFSGSGGQASGTFTAAKP